MMALAGPEVLLLALLTAGNALPDAVAFVPPRDYFETRKIETSVGSMMEQAVREPKDAKAQVAQLLALRQLETSVAELKKADKVADYRRTLEAIAAGSKANDALGFSKEYAARVLARLDGKEPASLPPLSLKEGFTWVPDTAALVGGFIMSHQTAAGKAPDLDRLFAMAPAEVKNEIYDGLERIGNVRIQRIAWGYGATDKQREASSIYLRITGKANAEWLVDFIKSKSTSKCVIDRKEGEHGEKMIFLNERIETRKRQPGEKVIEEATVETDAGPSLVFIGSGDLLIAGAARGGNNRSALTKMLATRSGDDPSVVKGHLSGQLGKIPAKAFGVVVGHLPPDLGPIPNIDRLKAIEAFALHEQGVDIKVTLTMDKADHAQELVKTMSEGRKQLVGQLKQAANNPPVPGVPIPMIIDVMEGLQLHQDADKVEIRLLLPEALLQALPTMFLQRAAGG